MNLPNALRIFQPVAPIAGGTLVLTSGTAYFVYIGYVTSPLLIQNVKGECQVTGAGAQTAEAGIFSTPLPPNGTNQSLTKLAATGNISSLTAVAPFLWTTASALNTVVAAGTYLWAGLRTAMAVTQPSISACCSDYSMGLVLLTAGAGVLTGAGPFAGVIPGIINSGNAIAPALRLTLD